MEREVARWLASQLGYNAASDSTLSANCRGNLKALWEWLMANYKTPEAKRHIQHVLARHRREQQAARRAPALQQEAAAQRARLAELRAKASTLERTLASFQAAVDSGVQDTTEQATEQALLTHDLREMQCQTLLLQAYVQRSHQLVPQLQARLATLRAALEVASARCQAAGGNRRLHVLQQQLTQLSSGIRRDLEKALEQQQLQHAGLLVPADLDAQHDQHGAAQQHAGAPDAGASWADALQLPALAGAGGSEHAQHAQLARHSLVTGFSPSAEAQAATLQLLQESPALLWACSSQLAAQACQELCAVLEETEGALLAPGSSSNGGGIIVASGAEQQQPASAAYVLPWATGAAGSAAAVAAADEALPPPELLVTQRQQIHLDMYVQAHAAHAAAAAADAELSRVLGSSPLLRAAAAALAAGPGAPAPSWEGRLACLHLRAAALRAEVALLQQREGEFRADAEVCREAEIDLQEKWEQICATVQRDSEVNSCLWQVASDNMDLAAALAAQQEAAAALLQQRLSPSGRDASDAARDGRDGLLREAGVVARLPVACLTAPQLLAGGAAGASSNRSLGRHTTLARLQLAAQRACHLGRATTGGKALAPPAAATGLAHAPLSPAGSSGGHSTAVDAAAIAALRGAAALDSVAAARCPGALLAEVSGQHQQLQQLRAQAKHLAAVSQAASAHASAAAARAHELQEQVEALHGAEQQAVLPWLASLLAEGQAGRAFAREELAADMAHFWELPAQHLLPEHTVQGMNCSQWLAEVQALHARRHELDGAAVGGR